MNEFLTAALIVLIIATNACHSHHGSHSHEMAGTEPVTLSHTLYGNHTELFVEFTPLIAGTESRFATHLTTLGETFTPLTEGTVSLALQDVNGSTTTSADVSGQPGIFHLALTPQYAGDAKLVFDVRTPTFSDRFEITAVMIYPDAQSARAASSSEKRAATEISFLKEQAWGVEFANMPAVRRPFHDVVKTSGIINPAPGTEQTVTARTSGIVAFVRNDMMTGMKTQAGQRLFTISSQDFTDASIPLKIQEAKIALDKATEDYTRLEQLLADQLTTRQEFLQAKAALDQAQVVYSNLTASYGAQGQTIAAAQDGYLKALFVTPGQYVETGQPLAVVSKSNRLTIKADLSPAIYAKIQSIHTANFRVNNAQVYTLEELNGKLHSIGQFADNSLFIPVWFEITQQPGIIPGTFVEVFLHVNKVDDALVIPVSALMEEQGVMYCYVQTGGESFEKRYLRLRGNDGIFVQVTSGIGEGERVVTRGAYHIKLSQASGTLPAHGHEH